MIRLLAFCLLTACAVPSATRDAGREIPDLSDDGPRSCQAPTSAPVSAKKLPRGHRTIVRLVGRVDSDSADKFEKDLEDAKGLVLVEIDGPGGEVDSGWRIMRAIERRGATGSPVACVVDHEAASMDMLILASCAERSMTRRSSIMAHEVRLDGSYSGHPNDWQAMADQLKAAQEALLEQYVRGSKVSVDEMRRRTEGGRQWWINWREALERGFVDRVVDSVEDAR